MGMNRRSLRKDKFDKLSFDCFVGFNTKQLWVYENNTNTLIDPPSEVLDKIDARFADDEVNWHYDEMENELQKVVDTNPGWLYDKDYWYPGDMDV